MPRAADEPVRLTRIYTRGGDAGETSLGDGSRVSKLDLRIAAYGTTDELNSVLGVVLAGDCPAELRAAAAADPERALRRRRRPLRPVRVEGRLRVEQAHGRRGSRPSCDRFNEPLPELKSFVLPGGTPAAAALHVARTVCRRAERETLAAARRARRQPARGRLPEPALRPPLHPRARGQCARRRRRAALEAGSVSLAGSRRRGLPGRAPARADLVRRTGRAHRLLPRRVRRPPRLDRRGAVRRARRALEPAAGPVLEPGRDRDRRPSRRQARRARRVGRASRSRRRPSSRRSRSGRGTSTSRERAGCTGSSSPRPRSSRRP